MSSKPQFPRRPKAAPPRSFARSSNRAARSPTSAPRKSSASARVLREVGLRLFAPTPVPVWTWSLTEGMHRDGEPAEAGTHDARGALDFIAALPRRRHLPPEGFSRAAARVRRESGAACATSTRAASTSASSSSSLRRCAPSRRNWSAACCFSNCGRPTWSNWPRSCARRARDASDAGSPSAGAAPCWD